MQSAQRWAQETFGHSQLGDARRTRRMVQMMAAAGGRPDGRISAVFRTPAERQAAYDFIEHGSVSPEAIVAAVGDACARKCAGRDLVEVVIDGTSLTLTDLKATKGFGYIGARRCKSFGLKVMNTLALTPQCEVLGVPTQCYWVRNGAAKKRGYQPPDRRESKFWRDAVDEVSERCARLAPQTRLHFLGDREADASLLMRRILELGHEFTIRANGTRVVDTGSRRIGVRERLLEQEPLAHITLRVCARAGGREREAILEVRAARVPLVLRDHQRKDRVIRGITVVWARESAQLTEGDKRVQWMLYSTDHAVDAAAACAVVQRYCRRWRIEEMHRTWKSGTCNVERMQLRSKEAATKWACMLAAVAAQVERLKTLSRTDPDQPASVVLREVEIRALILLKRKEKKRTETVPNAMPTIAQAARWIADLGGYVGHKSSGRPGSVVLTRGLERVLAAAETIEALEEQGPVKIR